MYRCVLILLFFQILGFVKLKEFLLNSFLSISHIFLLLILKMNVFLNKRLLFIAICWSAIPGFFILERIFLNEFQSYYMSRLSGGILRMNLNVDKVLIESVATSLW